MDKEPQPRRGVVEDNSTERHDHDRREEWVSQNGLFGSGLKLNIARRCGKQGARSNCNTNRNAITAPTKSKALRTLV